MAARREKVEMEKNLLSNRWVQFLAGGGVIALAYLQSPRTIIEVILAIGGCGLGGLFLLLSWTREQHQNTIRGRRLRV